MKVEGDKGHKIQYGVQSIHPSSNPYFYQMSSNKNIITKFYSFGAFCRVDIIDRVLSMMDKYAGQLEDIVEDRTKQLMNEKKRTDLLLHRILPP